MHLSPPSGDARRRDFRLFWYSGAVSRLGSHASSVALPILVLGLGGSPLTAGVLGSVGTGVTVVTTPIAGDDEILPGIAMGTVPATGEPSELAERLYRDGVRRVALSRPVELDGGMDKQTLVWTMMLLRELTSWGVVTDWRLRPGEYAHVWQRLNHLYPPMEILGEPDSAAILSDWRETFYLCKCIFRQGPGFIEVRDRRAGNLARFVIDDPAYLAVIDQLLLGAVAAELPAQILQEFVDEGLAGLAGDLAWWLPYRVRRWPWPWPSMIV